MPSLNQKSVLIVDDDPAVLNALAFALGAEGYRVLACDSSSAAMDMARRETVSCLLLDYRLPGLDGIELASALKRHGIDSPVVIITTHPDMRCRARAASIKAVIVEKPLIGDRLSRQIQRMLE